MKQAAAALKPGAYSQNRESNPGPAHYECKKLQTAFNTYSHLKQHNSLWYKKLALTRSNYAQHQITYRHIILYAVFYASFIIGTLTGFYSEGFLG